MQWNSSYQESVFSFANNINTIEGGIHLSGFRSALTSALNKYAQDKGELKEKDDTSRGEDVREGLTAVISAKLPTRSSRARPRPSSAIPACRASSARSYTPGWPSSSRRTRRTPGAAIRKASRPLRRARPRARPAT